MGKAYYLSAAFLKGELTFFYKGMEKRPHIEPYFLNLTVQEVVTF